MSHDVLVCRLQHALHLTACQRHQTVAIPVTFPEGEGQAVSPYLCFKVNTTVATLTLNLFLPQTSSISMYNVVLIKRKGKEKTMLSPYLQMSLSSTIISAP